MAYNKNTVPSLLLGFSLLLITKASIAIDVQGHRGARAVLPENSLPGFEYALRIGVDTIELDTGVSRDGVVVVTHDQQINPTICQYKNGAKATKGLYIHQLSLAEIKQFDCGRRANPRFKKQTLIAGTEIPTLREVFDLVAQSTQPNAKSVRYNIETKSDPRNPSAQPTPTVFAKAILDLVDEYKLASRVTIQSFDHRTLLATHRLNPSVTTAALYYKNLSDWVTPTLAVKASIVSPQFTDLNNAEVLAIHDAGLTVIPWTANTKKNWIKLIDMGVDGIITDDPKPLLELLGRQ